MQYNKVYGIIQDIELAQNHHHQQELDWMRPQALSGELLRKENTLVDRERHYKHQFGIL